MAKVPTVKVDKASMNAIFDALRILPKTESGKLPAADAHPPLPARNHPGTSHIVKHFRAADGIHVATSHRLIDQNGVTTHWHGKDILLGELRFVADEYGP